MTLTERFENDKIEIVGKCKAIHVRRATVIERDGVELTRSFHRHVLHPLTKDGNGNIVDTDLSGEDEDVQAIAAAAWTDDVKEVCRDLINTRASEDQLL